MKRSYAFGALAALGAVLTLGLAAHAQPPGGPAPPPAPFKIIPVVPSFGAAIIAPDTQLETIVTIPGVSFEGAMWRKGKIRLSDQKNGPIYEVSLDGTWKMIADNMAGGPVDPAARYNQGPNGQAPWPGGAEIFARQSFRDLGKMDKNGKITTFLADFNGKRFNAPNDLVVGRDGAIWITDPTFSLPGASRAPGAPPSPFRQIPFAGVFRYKAGKITAAITDLPLPNGIGLSPDGKTLYVDNSAPDMILRAYDIGKDGALSNMRELLRIASNSGWGRGVPDGLRVDGAGNIWMTAPGGLVVVDPKGKLLGRLQLPLMVTSMAFGADDHSLFIAAGPNLYRLRLLVKGLLPTYTLK